MVWLRRVLWLLSMGAVIWAAMRVTQRYEISDRLLGAFLALNPSLPSWMSFERFLVVALAVCVLLLLLVLLSAFIGFFLMRRSVLLVHSKQAAQEAALQHALERLKAQVQQEYERLINLSATLTQRLDKRAILQNVLRAASQVTTLPQADSLVGLWVLDFETDRMRFEMGTRCDESFFSKHQFELSEPPFARLLSTKAVQRFATWEEGFPHVVPEKATQLGQARALLLIPLIIERTVLGALAVFCHPDIFATYDQQETFFNTAWGQLTLALSIAIQGELAILDRLTGVVNQTYFLKRVAQEIERGTRYQLSTSLLMIDIDDFKAVNDTLGHPQGDAVLKIVAKLIKQEVRAIDLVGRYGGEEFIAMLPETGFTEELGGSAGALVVAERIRKAVENEFHDLQHPLAITVSIGVAVRRSPEDRQMDTRELVRVADVQLYKAKAAGKNRCCVSMPEKAEPVA